MAVLIVVAAGIQIVIAWTWFWPARWWDWLRNLPRIGYQGATDFVRSLIAWSISVWLVMGGFLIVFQVYGKRQPPAALVIPILAPLLIGASVTFFGFPQFLVPPAARDDSDIEDVSWVRQHPFLSLILLLVFAAVATVGIVQRAAWLAHRNP